MYSFTEVFKPKFFSLFKKGRYDRQSFVSDLIAGIIVGIIALPLAIAFGIASGVTPQQGLVTAIVAGFLMSLFGGSRFLIGGPTGAFIVIVAGIIAQYGMQGLIIASIMAGVILVVMGVCKLGILFKFRICALEICNYCFCNFCKESLVNSKFHSFANCTANQTAENITCSDI